MTEVSSPRASDRLGFLDCLRGVAVLLVIAQHVIENNFPALEFLTVHVVQLGQMGVMVFFCCSGFIIPVSLDRAGTLRRFWIARFFRLYPLYWLSLLLALLLSLVGRFNTSAPMGALDWLVNVTMAQQFLGRPDAIGLYWTLAWEMAFYIGVSILFIIKLNRFSVAVSLCASIGLVVAGTIVAMVFPGHHVPMGLFIFAAMLHGTVWQRWYSGRVRTPVLAGVVGAAAAAGFVLIYFNLRNPKAPLSNGTDSITAMAGAWLGALAIFAVAVAWRRAGPRWLRRVGVISYSMYLLQALVFSVFVGPPGIVQATMWVVLTVVASELTYRYVEKPAIAIGRRVAANSSKRADAPQRR